MVPHPMVANPTTSFESRAEEVSREPGELERRRFVLHVRTPESLARTGTRATGAADGIDVHWVEMGRGPPIVLLHGLHDSHRTWNTVAPALAQRHRVLMPDLPGHGLSGRPDSTYAVAWHARIMSSWLDALDLRDVDVVGHSFGGGVAQYMVYEGRLRIRRLALVAAGGLGKEVGLAVRLLSVPWMLERFGQPFMTHATRAALLVTGDVFAADEAAWLAWVNAMPGTARAAGRTVRDVVGLRGQKRQFFDHAHELEQLPPVALFWGERDRIIPFAHAVAIQKAVDGVTLTTFPKCGHFPHRERPVQFADALARFLDAPAVRPARLRPAPTLRGMRVDRSLPAVAVSVPPEVRAEGRFVANDVSNVGQSLFARGRAFVRRVFA